MQRPKAAVTVFVLLTCFSAAAQLLQTQGDLTTNDLTARSFRFQAEPGKILLQISVNTRPGTVAFEVRGPEGTLLGKQSAGVATINAWSLNLTNRGDYQLIVSPHATAGHWQVRIQRVPPLRALYEQVVSGALMMLVALSAILVWWAQSRVPWRWFWAGAGIWTVGVALKFAAAVPLNPILLGTSGHATAWRLACGAVYCGLMTGVFEIGITLAAALVWRGLAAEPDRAVAVGLGAGAFEALLLGLASFAGALVPLASGQTDMALNSLVGVGDHTPLLWLTSPVERVIAILTHTASRVLVLRAVAGRNWSGFWIGFTWLSAIDLMAGVALLRGMTTSGSLWWIELMILPFGVLSLPLAAWGLRRWPGATPSASLKPSTPQPTGAPNLHEG